MERARKELGRLMTFKNPYSWAVPGNKEEEHRQHHYFFLDRDNESTQGDTPLLRLLALHACSETVENFLRHSKCLGPQKGDKTELSEQADEITMARKVVLRSNRHGVSPLHVAVHRNSWYAVEIVRLLLTVDPSLVRRRMELTGTYPLHVSMANNLTIRSQVLEDLLSADPSIVFEEDVNRDNPVSLLYKNVLRFRWARDWETQNRPPESIVCDSSWMTVIAPDQFRDFCLAMISAGQKYKRGRSDLTWHGVCSFPRCPPLLIKVLEMELSRESLLQPDEDGKVPLHHAAKALAMSTTSIPFHVAEETALALERVMRLEPRAASMVDHSGKYPLHYALENLTIEGFVIEELVDLSPVEALMTPDPRTRLFPFQLAAVRAECDDASHESLIYNLLRLEPSVTSR